jgi:HK97 family phage prohead protease
MPYFITQESPDCSGWAVIDDAGEQFGCHTTKQSAIDQAVAISINTDEPFEGERAALDALQVGDWVSWLGVAPEVVGRIELVAGPMAGVRIYELEEGIYTNTDKIAVMNVLKLERIDRPEFVAEDEDVIMGDVPAQDVPDSPDMPDDSPDDVELRLEDGPRIIISDIDGTLLSGGNRIERVWQYIQQEEGELFLVTGRPDSTRADTIKELRDAGITYSELRMNSGSSADSVEFKKSEAESLLETYDVVLAVENNPDALRAYRSLGIEAIDPAKIDAVDTESRAINQEAPAYMRAAARRGLEYYAEGLGGDGLVERTIREARDMAEGRVTDDKWIRIAAWIARHLDDLDAPDANPESDGYPSPGVVAHLLWGSGPTKRAARRTLDFAESVVARIRAEESERMIESNEARDKWLSVAWAIKTRLEGETAVRSVGGVEKRTNHVNLEVRADGDGMTFEGYAAVFNSPSEPLPFTEVIKPGAFRKSLQGRHRMMLLWNHDASQPLASTRNGSLRMVEDEIGLKVTATLPNTQLGRDISEMVRTNLIDAMSFGFRVKRDSWSADGSVRTLEEVAIFESSLVSFPAYEGTAGSVSVRDTRDIDPNTLADGLLRLESGEELSEEHAAAIGEVVAKLTKTEEVQAVDGDILALKKKKLDLLMKEGI